MSERDEPSKTRKRRKRPRRSLRVPVDEVPRPTLAAGVSGEIHFEGSSTTEMAAYAEEEDRRDTPFGGIPVGARTLTDGSNPLEELDPANLEELDPSLLDESFVTAPHAAVDPVDDEAPVDALTEDLLGTPREDGGEEEIAPEATVVQEPPSELEEAKAREEAEEPVEDEPELEQPPADEPEHEEEEAEDEERAEAEDEEREEEEPEEEEEEPAAQADEDEEAPQDEDEEPPEEPQSLEVDIDGERAAEDEEPARDEAPSEDEEPAADAPKVSSVGVIVQRVVHIVSAPGSAPAPEPAPEEQAQDEEVDVDVDDEGPRRDSTPELLAEEAEDLLEEVEARDEKGSTPRKRNSRPPPPPPKGKEAPASLPPKGKETPTPAPAKEVPVLREQAPSREVKETPREPFSTTSREATRPPGKKPRRNWWEELFSDDYLRTVPIPHPKVIARQCDFIEQRLGLAHGATILDVGCGLGLHAVELTRRGYLVVGLDLSLPMLSRAADEAQDQGFKINFLHADMREMNFDGAFDAVLCWGTTLGYFDDETNKQVVERLYRALKPRGLLLLEVSNRDFVIRNQPNLVWFEGDGCVVMEESQMNYITSRLDVKRTVILDDGRQRDNLYSIRLYSLHELGQILHHQGFRVVEVTGLEAHPGVFFGSDSAKLIILAERRAAPSMSSRVPSGEMPAVTDSPSIPAEAPPPEEPVEEAAPAADPHAPPSEDVSAALAETLAESSERAVLDQAQELDPSELDEEVEPDKG